MKGSAISSGPGDLALSFVECVYFLLLLFLHLNSAVSAAVPRLTHASTKNGQKSGLPHRFAADISIYKYSLWYILWGLNKVQKLSQEVQKSRPIGEKRRSIYHFKASDKGPVTRPTLPFKFDNRRPELLLATGACVFAVLRMAEGSDAYSSRRCTKKSLTWEYYRAYYTNNHICMHIAVRIWRIIFQRRLETEGVALVSV